MSLVVRSNAVRTRQVQRAVVTAAALPALPAAAALPAIVVRREPAAPQTIDVTDTVNRALEQDQAIATALAAAADTQAALERTEAERDGLRRMAMLMVTTASLEREATDSRLRTEKERSAALRAQLAQAHRAVADEVASHIAAFVARLDADNTLTAPQRRVYIARMEALAQSVYDELTRVAATPSAIAWAALAYALAT